MAADSGAARVPGRRKEEAGNQAAGGDVRVVSSSLLLSSLELSDTPIYEP